MGAAAGLTAAWRQRGLLWLLPALTAALDAVACDAQNLPRVPPPDADPDRVATTAREHVHEATVVLRWLEHPAAAGWFGWLGDLMDTQAPADAVWRVAEVGRALCDLFAAGVPGSADILSAAARHLAPPRYAPSPQRFLPVLGSWRVPGGDDVAAGRAAREGYRAALAGGGGAAARERWLLQGVRPLLGLRTECALLLAALRCLPATTVDPLESRFVLLWAEALRQPTAAPAALDAWRDDLLMALLPAVTHDGAAAAILTRILPGWVPPTPRQRWRLIRATRGFQPETWGAFLQAFRHEIATVSDLLDARDATGSARVGVLLDTLDGVGLGDLATKYRPLPTDAPIETAAVVLARLERHAADPHLLLDIDADASLRRGRARDWGMAWHGRVRDAMDCLLAVPAPADGAWIRWCNDGAAALAVDAGTRAAAGVLHAAAALRTENERSLPLVALERYCAALATGDTDAGDLLVACSRSDDVVVPTPAGAPAFAIMAEVAATAPTLPAPAPDLEAMIWSELRHHHERLAAALRATDLSVTQRRGLSLSLDIIAGGLGFLPVRAGHEVIDRALDLLHRMTPWDIPSPDLRAALEAVHTWLGGQPEILRTRIRSSDWQRMCRAAAHTITTWVGHTAPTWSQYEALRAIQRASPAGSGVLHPVAD